MSKYVAYFQTFNKFNEIKTEISSIKNQINFYGLIIYKKGANQLIFLYFQVLHQKCFTLSIGLPCIGPAVQAGLLTYKQLYTLYAFSLNVTAS